MDPFDVGYNEMSEFVATMKKLPSRTQVWVKTPVREVDEMRQVCDENKLIGDFRNAFTNKTHALYTVTKV